MRGGVSLPIVKSPFNF